MDASENIHLRLIVIVKNRQQFENGIQTMQYCLLCLKQNRNTKKLPIK